MLFKTVVDRHNDPRDLACSFFKLAYAVKVKNLPNGLSAREFTRQQLDRLGIGAKLTYFRWGSKTVPLPPSRLVK